jgi:hypothetical protein
MPGNAISARRTNSSSGACCGVGATSPRVTRARTASPGDDPLTPRNPAFGCRNAAPGVAGPSCAAASGYWLAVGSCRGPSGLTGRRLIIGLISAGDHARLPVFSIARRDQTPPRKLLRFRPHFGSQMCRILSATPQQLLQESCGWAATNRVKSAEMRCGSRRGVEWAPSRSPQPNRFETRRCGGRRPQLRAANCQLLSACECGRRRWCRRARWTCADRGSSRLSCGRHSQSCLAAARARTARVRRSFS